MASSERDRGDSIGLAAGAWQLSLPLLVRGHEVTENSNERLQSGVEGEAVGEEGSRPGVEQDLLSLNSCNQTGDAQTSTPSNMLDTNIDYNQLVLDVEESLFNCEEEMAKLDELDTQLSAIKEIILDTTIRSHLMNIDLVTQFNPNTVETLNKTVEECKACIARLEEI